MRKERSPGKHHPYRTVERRNESSTGVIKDLVIESQCSKVESLEASNSPQDRGLACPVSADEAENLSPLHVQGDDKGELLSIDPDRAGETHVRTAPSHRPRRPMRTAKEMASRPMLRETARPSSRWSAR